MQAEKITALYARFSHDENTLGDSNSVTHQKIMLTDYANTHGFTNCRIYADDGYTGVNFNRPDFQRMMTDIENGLVGTVIVKDLSRLGRNYLMVGQYTEMVFPSYGIRFIAINDNVDSAEGMNDMIPFSNLVNEWYSRDISKKIKAVFHQKGRSGKRLSTKPIYGYKRDPENKDNWIIDEYAANVIRRIYSLYLEGYGIRQIANILRDEKIQKPNVYLHYAHDDNGVPEYQYEWNTSTVVTFLTKPEYCGDTVNFRTYRMSYKNKKTVWNPPEKRMIFRDTHPAIIDRETFEKVQKIYACHYRKHTKGGDNTLFFGYLFCMDCKGRMHIDRRRIDAPLSQTGFECSTYRKKIKHNLCFKHRTPYREVEDYVTVQLVRLFYMANSKKNRLKAMVDSSLDAKYQSSAKAVHEAIESAQSRVEEINKYTQNLFEAKVRGEIDSEIFANLSKTYIEEKKVLNEQIADLTVKEVKLNEKEKLVHSFYTALAKYDDFHELTPQLMRDLIDRIEIGAVVTDAETGEKTRKIDIYYVGVGALKFD